MVAAVVYAAMFGRTKVKVSVAAVGLALGMCVRLHAMDRWSALSQIESGDDDRATGGAGEISRYQIKPEVWQRYAPATTDWTDPENALSVAKQAMQERCAAFERSAHRAPTDFEFYVLWNAPAQVERPSKVVAERAERFCNLVAVQCPPARDLADQASAPVPATLAASDRKTASEPAPGPGESSSSKPSAER